MVADISVYLAGPGVFRQDAAVWGSRLKTACDIHGLVGLFPLDNALPALPDERSKREWIFQQNCTMISRTDLVFADMRAFRSASEPDSGTAFEVGFAFALGKPVWLWLSDVTADTPMYKRIPSAFKQQNSWMDNDNNAIEDFGVPLNLMLWQAATGVIVANSPELAIAELVKRARLPVLRHR